MKTAFALLLLCASLDGCARNTEEERPLVLAAHSRNVSADIHLMWQTQPMSGHPSDFASTPQAIEAADRVFAAVRLNGLTRKEVVAMLGDPRHSSPSIYNFPFYPVPVGALAYRFDTGAGGLQVTLSFDKEGKVRAVKKQGII